jgi:Holliday junction DNA helicase RuvA
MISRLTGILVEKHPPTLLLDVHGVGYDIEAPLSTFYQLPELHQQLTLLTHLIIREEAMLLYGFLRESERELFRTLIKVNGVGAKMALNILSAMELEIFVHCIQSGDIQRLIKIPNVGKKTAERLIVELRDRLTALRLSSPAVVTSAEGETTTPPHKIYITSPVEDAISALVALGYKPQEASRWVHSVEEANLSSEELIRRALRAAM